MSRVNQLHKLLSHNSLDIPANRATGQTTALALQYISDAMKAPNTRIVVKDHPSTPPANKLLVQAIRRLLDQMRLQFFVFTAGYEGYYLEFQLYAEEVPQCTCDHCKRLEFRRTRLRQERVK